MTSSSSHILNKSKPKHREYIRGSNEVKYKFWDISYTILKTIETKALFIQRLWHTFGTEDSTVAIIQTSTEFYSIYLLVIVLICCDSVTGT